MTQSQFYSSWHMDSIVRFQMGKTQTEEWLNLGWQDNSGQSQVDLTNRIMTKDIFCQTLIQAKLHFSVCSVPIPSTWSFSFTPSKLIRNSHMISHHSPSVLFSLISECGISNLSNTWKPVLYNIMDKHFSTFLWLPSSSQTAGTHFFPHQRLSEFAAFYDRHFICVWRSIPRGVK